LLWNDYCLLVNLFDMLTLYLLCMAICWVVCKGCLVKYVACYLHCPKCKVLIHPTDPLVNIRFDYWFFDSCSVVHFCIITNICLYWSVMLKSWICIKMYVVAFLATLVSQLYLLNATFVFFSYDCVVRRHDSTMQDIVYKLLPHVQKGMFCSVHCLQYAIWCKKMCLLILYAINYIAAACSIENLKCCAQFWFDILFIYRVHQ